jgi:hypothetical protein
MPQIIHMAVINNVVNSRRICINYLRLATYDKFRLTASSSKGNPVSSPGSLYIRNTKLEEEKINTFSPGIHLLYH